MYDNLIWQWKRVVLINSSVRKYGFFSLMRFGRGFVKLSQKCIAPLGTLHHSSLNLNVQHIQPVRDIFNWENVAQKMPVYFNITELIFKHLWKYVNVYRECINKLSKKRLSYWANQRKHEKKLKFYNNKNSLDCTNCLYSFLGILILFYLKLILYWVWGSLFVF